MFQTCRSPTHHNWDRDEPVCLGTATEVTQRSSGSYRWTASASVLPEKHLPLSVARLECSPLCRKKEPASEASPLCLLDLDCRNMFAERSDASQLVGELGLRRPRAPSCSAGTSTSLSVYCNCSVAESVLNHCGLPLCRDRTLDELQLPSLSIFSAVWAIATCCCATTAWSNSQPCSRAVPVTCVDGETVGSSRRF